MTIDTFEGAINLMGATLINTDYPKLYTLRTNKWPHNIFMYKDKIMWHGTTYTTSEELQQCFYSLINGFT